MAREPKIVAHLWYGLGVLEDHKSRELYPFINILLGFWGPPVLPFDTLGVRRFCFLILEAYRAKRLRNHCSEMSFIVFKLIQSRSFRKFLLTKFADIFSILSTTVELVSNLNHLKYFKLQIS